MRKESEIIQALDDEGHDLSFGKDTPTLRLHVANVANWNYSTSAVQHVHSFDGDRPSMKDMENARPQTSHGETSRSKPFRKDFSRPLTSNGYKTTPDMPVLNTPFREQQYAEPYIGVALGSPTQKSQDTPAAKPNPVTTKISAPLDYKRDASRLSPVLIPSAIPASSMPPPSPRTLAFRDRLKTKTNASTNKKDISLPSPILVASPRLPIPSPAASPALPTIRKMASQPGFITQDSKPIAVVEQRAKRRGTLSSIFRRKKPTDRAESAMSSYPDGTPTTPKTPTSAKSMPATTPKSQDEPKHRRSFSFKRSKTLSDEDRPPMPMPPSLPPAKLTKPMKPRPLDPKTFLTVPSTNTKRISRPQLDIDIPKSEFQRYSIMFSDVLGKPATVESPDGASSILSRRKGDGERLRLSPRVDQSQSSHSPQHSPLPQRSPFTSSPRLGVESQVRPKTAPSNSESRPFQHDPITISLRPKMTPLSSSTRSSVRMQPPSPAPTAPLPNPLNSHHSKPSPIQEDEEVNFYDAPTTPLDPFPDNISPQHAQSPSTSSITGRRNRGQTYSLFPQNSPPPVHVESTMDTTAQSVIPGRTARSNTSTAVLGQQSQNRPASPKKPAQELSFPRNRPLDAHPTLHDSPANTPPESPVISAFSFPNQKASLQNDIMTPPSPSSSSSLPEESFGLSSPPSSYTDTNLIFRHPWHEQSQSGSQSLTDTFTDHLLPGRNTSNTTSSQVGHASRESSTLGATLVASIYPPPHNLPQPSSTSTSFYNAQSESGSPESNSTTFKPSIHATPQQVVHKTSAHSNFGLSPISSTSNLNTPSTITTNTSSPGTRFGYDSPQTPEIATAVTRNIRSSHSASASAESRAQFLIRGDFTSIVPDDDSDLDSYSESRITLDASTRSYAQMPGYGNAFAQPAQSKLLGSPLHAHPNVYTPGNIESRIPKSIAGRDYERFGPSTTAEATSASQLASNNPYRGTRNPAHTKPTVVHVTRPSAGSSYSSEKRSQDTVDLNLVGAKKGWRRSVWGAGQGAEDAGWNNGGRW